VAKSEVREKATLTPPEKKPPRFGLVADGTSSPAGLIIKIVVLAVVLAIAVWAALPLLADQRWVGLAIVVLITALLFYIYLSPRRVPAKYLIPGTLFLIVFQIVPVLYTMSTAFTNFGDAHRGSKEDAIAAIEGTSVQQVPGSAEYVLSLATEGDPATGDIVFLLTDPATQQSFAGTSEGLEELVADDIQVGPDGKVVEAPGYTVLSIGQASARAEDISQFSVPTDRGAMSFAFNFNNFNGIFLVSEGAPFPPDNPQAGNTDILITYTYRLAFGGAGAQYGLAAAVSIFIFLIVAIISIISFRRTHALEEIN
jgi:arabinogalactan oligomer / maltooligosaccharide transport system permease protein